VQRPVQLAICTEDLIQIKVARALICFTYFWNGTRAVPVLLETQRPPLERPYFFQPCQARQRVIDAVRAISLAPAPEVAPAAISESARTIRQSVTESGPYGEEKHEPVSDIDTVAVLFLLATMPVNFEPLLALVDSVPLNADIETHPLDVRGGNHWMIKSLAEARRWPTRQPAKP